MEKRTCKDCGAENTGGNFYAGVPQRCKECHKAFVKKNRAAKIAQYKEYDRTRFQQDPRVRERHRRYQKTDEGKEAMQRSRDKWVDVNPEKRAAHITVGNAVRDGKLEKPTTCEDCGKATRSRGLHAHHEDYSRPLDVNWVCIGCHRRRHQ